jgi:glycosyltransferase involved in cell wall biosynthesis
MKKKRVAIIGTVGIPAKYGGFETFAEQLVHELNDRYELHVYCSSKRYAKAERLKQYHQAHLHYIPFDANGYQSILYDLCCMVHALFRTDVFLVLGVSGGLFLPFFKWFTRIKIIISIDGVEWRRSKWSTLSRWYLWLSERVAVYHSHQQIADNEVIREYFSNTYNKQPFMIAYGGDHTTKVAPEPEDYQRYPFIADVYAFSVCRIEPENNVELMLKAFAHKSAQLFVIVGNWNISSYGRMLRKKYNGIDNILMLDAIYDRRELDVLRSCASVYVHGHSAGGTNPSLVEAMHLQLPILAFDVNFNRATTQEAAFYFRSAEELCRLIEVVSPEQLKANAAKMKAIANQYYSWKLIVGQLEDMFDAQTIEKTNSDVKPILDIDYSTLKRIKSPLHSPMHGSMALTDA